MFLVTAPSTSIDCDQFCVHGIPRISHTGMMMTDHQGAIQDGCTYGMETTSPSIPTASITFFLHFLDVDCASSALCDLARGRLPSLPSHTGSSCVVPLHSGDVYYGCTSFPRETCRGTTLCGTAWRHHRKRWFLR